MTGLDARYDVATPTFALGWLAIGLALFLSGCAPTRDVLVLSSWQVFVGSTPGEATALPAHFDARLGSTPSRFVLRTTVALPAAFRAQRLTLAIPYFAGRTQLRVGGESIEAIGGSRPDTFRSGGAHAWRIPNTLTTAETLPLELTIEHEWPLSAWFDTVPRLSVTSDGDSTSRLIWRASDVSTLIAAAVAVFLALTYARIFFYARTRTGHGWFGVQAACASAYPFFCLGLTQCLGKIDTALMLSLVTGANIAGVHFMHAHFRLGPPPRIWRWAWVACAVTLVVGARDPFAAVKVGAPVNAVVMWCAAGYQIVTYIKLVASPRRPRHAVTFLSAWLVLAALASVDLIAWMGFGELLGGFHPACLGVTIFGLLQYAALSQEHAVINLELTARLHSLEVEESENRRLTSELRRQVHERSRQIHRLVMRTSASAGSPLPLAKDDLVGGLYRIRRPIGSGGMGRVYEAERETDRARVAVKVLKGEHTTEALARLAREAQIASQLGHRNLISMLDVGALDPYGVYLVMELVEGPSLEENRWQFGSASWVVPVLAELAEGLAAIHSAGIVHRDLKPSNILFKPADDDTVILKICDFGIAMLGTITPDPDAPPVTPATQRSAAPESLLVTRPGAVVGTPQYMAPELAKGSRLATPAADMFSFGVIAFELIVGRRPVGPSPAIDAVLGEVFAEEPSILGYPGIDAVLAQHIHECLRVDPTRRPNARDVARSLGPTTPIVRFHRRPSLRGIEVVSSTESLGAEAVRFTEGRIRDRRERGGP